MRTKKIRTITLTTLTILCLTFSSQLMTLTLQKPADNPAEEQRYSPFINPMPPSPTPNLISFEDGAHSDTGPN